MNIFTLIRTHVRICIANLRYLFLFLIAKSVVVTESDWPVHATVMRGLDQANPRWHVR